LLVGSNVPVGEPHHAGSEEGKDGADAQNDEPPETLGKGRRSAEEVALPIVALAVIAKVPEQVDVI